MPVGNRLTRTQCTCSYSPPISTIGCFGDCDSQGSVTAQPPCTQPVGFVLGAQAVYGVTASHGLYSVGFTEHGRDSLAVTEYSIYIRSKCGYCVADISIGLRVYLEAVAAKLCIFGVCSIVVHHPAHLVELAVLVADVGSVQSDVLCSDCCTDGEKEDCEYIFHDGEVEKLMEVNPCAACIYLQLVRSAVVDYEAIHRS